MARVLSQVATLIRGSVGGITYFANQYHPILMRARVAPVQPDTQNQTRIRSAMTYASQQWLYLTPPDRQAWDDYAATLVYQGPAGSYTITGRQCFVGNIGWMRYLLSRGLAFSSSQMNAPTVPGFLGVSSCESSAPTAPEVGVNWTIRSDNIEDCIAVMERSIPFNLTRNNYKGPYESTSLKSVLLTIGVPNTLEFTGLVAGMRYFFTLRLIVDDAEKRISSLFRYSAQAQVGV